MIVLRSLLATLLDRHHYQLIDVMRRQFVMEALTKELDRVTPAHRSESCLSSAVAHSAIPIARE